MNKYVLVEGLLEACESFERFLEYVEISTAFEIILLWMNQQDQDQIRYPEI